MVDNTNPQAKRFSNEKARTAADAIDSCYETLKRLQAEYVAVGGDTLFPATSDNVADESDADGRKRMTNNAVRGLKNLADAMVTFLEAGGPPTRITQVKAVSVNGRAAY